MEMGKVEPFFGAVLAYGTVIEVVRSPTTYKYKY